MKVGDIVEGKWVVTAITVPIWYPEYTILHVTDGESTARLYMSTGDI